MTDRQMIYRRWNNIKARCYNKNKDNYDRYGGRGIHVCSEWLNDFETFYQWALSNGFKPELQIDRIDNNGPYSPDNCRFVDRVQNARNTRTNRMITAFGETKCVPEWAEDNRCVVHYNLLSERIRKGVSPEVAMIEPAKGQIPYIRIFDLSKGQAGDRMIKFVRVICAFGKIQTIEQWARELNICEGAIWMRLYRGDKGETALRKTDVLITAYGKTQTIKEWSAETGISRAAIYTRLSRGKKGNDVVKTRSVKRA